METKTVEDTMCKRCKERVKELRTDIGQWFITRFKDKIYMRECNGCKNILVRKLINTLSSSIVTRSKLIKIISNQDPEYIIWKLK